MQQIDISYIIVNYRTPELVLQCVQSIQLHGGSRIHEIIVVDNGSEDDSNIMLQKQEGIMLIQNESNHGFGRANNQAAFIAKGRYLLFLNPDTYLLNDAADILATFMDNPRNHAIACCGADLFDEKGHRQVSYGNFPSLCETFSQIGFYRLYKSYFYNQLAIGVRNTGEDVKEVDYISGAAMFVRAIIFRNLGGFDSDFFLYFEETEFAYRLKKNGYLSVLVPAARLVHLEGASHEAEAKVNYSKIKLFSASRQLFFRKTKGRMVAFLVKLLLSMQALGQGIFHWDRHYLKVFCIIMRS